jgi:hypothetical protein
MPHNDSCCYGRQCAVFLSRTITLICYRVYAVLLQDILVHVNRSNRNTGCNPRSGAKCNIRALRLAQFWIQKRNPKATAAGSSGGGVGGRLVAIVAHRT